MYFFHTKATIAEKIESLVDDGLSLEKWVNVNPSCNKSKEEEEEEEEGISQKKKKKKNAAARTSHGAEISYHHGRAHTLASA